MISSQRVLAPAILAILGSTGSWALINSLKLTRAHSSGSEWLMGVTETVNRRQIKLLALVMVIAQARSKEGSGETEIATPHSGM